MKLRPLLLCCALAAAFSPAAQAGVISLDSYQLASSKQSGSFTYNGSTQSTWAGEISFNYSQGSSYGFGAGVLDAFCIEPSQTLSTPAVYVIESGLSLFGSAQQSLIAGLYDNFYARAVSNAQTAAFQLVLWEIVADGTGVLNLGNGSFRTSHAFGGQRSIASDWLGELNTWYAGLTSPYQSNSYEFFTLRSAASQNQLSVRERQQVSEPGILALLGIGLVAGGLARRRRG